MPYRGEDLDLRTPQGFGPASSAQGGRDASGTEPNWWTRSTVYMGGRADPIWVDDSVMACCNHAFDLAIAHRAPEVRLEHLINAMTMNETVAPMLEARGIAVALLRRESGAVLATDSLAGPINGKSQPKRSEALEETLRLSADRAYQRRTPVTIDDVLHVLFDMKRDLPGLALLRRHASPWPSGNGAENRPDARPDPRHDARSDLRLEPLPHLSRPQFRTEPARYPSSDEGRPRYASQSAHDYFTQQPDTFTRAPFTQQPLAAPQSAPSAQFRQQREREQPAIQTDVLQNNRLDTLDRAVRDLSLDLADERKSLQAIVTELQRQTSSQADDTNRFRGGLTERLNALEDTLMRARSEPQQLPQPLFDRISALERNIDARLTESARSQPLASVFTDRLAAIERMLDQRVSEIGRNWGAVADRLQALETQSMRPAETALPPMLAARLESVGGLERKLDTLERTFSLILDRLTGLERNLGQAKPLDLAPLQVKLADMERNVVARVGEGIDLNPVTDLLSGIETRVTGLERSIENRSAETGRTVSFIGERLRAFEESISGHKIETADRLGQIERTLTAYAERTVEAGSGHERDLSELHEALVKLNGNQQTLAASLEQWRLDNTGDLSVVSNRLKFIEDTTQRRDALVDTLLSQVGAIHSAVAKREVRKSRLRNWLFGTDEWYAASYDTENWRARQAGDILRGLEGRPQPRPMQAQPPSVQIRR